MKIEDHQANRTEDLARGLCETFERGGLRMAGSLITDYRWLAEQLADVILDEPAQGHAPVSDSSRFQCLPMPSCNFNFTECYRFLMQRLFKLKLVLTLFTGLLAMLYWQRYSAFEDLVSQIFHVLFIYSFASIIFRFGWVVPCIVLGMLAGMFCEMWERAYSGPLGRMEAQIWEMVFKIGVGFVVGLLIGIRFDFSQQRSLGKSAMGKI